LKIERVGSGGDLERRIVTGMILSDPVLSRISSMWDSDLFGTRLARTVAKWCVDYHRSYGKSPGEDVTTAFAAFIRDEKDEDFCESIETFLVRASEDSKQKINPEYLLDQAEDHFNRIKLKHLAEDIEAHLVQGSVGEAQASVVEFDRVHLTNRTGVDLLLDMEAWKDIFEESAESLFKFPGALGELMNNYLVRDGLIGIQGPEKRGKTWWLIEFAVQALMGRNRVVFFEVGDMSEKQIKPRFGSRWTQKPWRISGSRLIEWPRDLRYEGSEIILDYEPKTFQGSFRYDDLTNGLERVLKRIGVKDRTMFKLSCHPNSTISVREIRGLLDMWEMAEDFIPDVVVIDYADILAPENSRVEFRHQVNDTWKALRALSQEKHCLVLTATQASATAYKRPSQSIGDFSEDKRKMAHVTGMLGLNQTEDEKERRLMRLAWLVLREGFFTPRQQVLVSQCLELGRPFVQSIWKTGGKES